jgi:hypothetical protein
VVGVPCDKVQRWVSLISPANRDLPIIKCCGKLWSPVDILNACLSNDPSFSRLEQILEAHGIGGDSPVNYNEITQARLEKVFKNVHVLIGQAGQSYVIGPEQLMQMIKEGKGLGKRLNEAELITMMEELSKYG